MNVGKLPKEIIMLEKGLERGQYDITKALANYRPNLDMALIRML